MTTVRTATGRALLTAAYGALGGCMDDHVVELLARTFLAHGVHVATFNARGVRGSGGRVSWTSRPECEDYQVRAAACGSG